MRDSCLALASRRDQCGAEKKKKKTIFVVANLFIFIFIFRDVKRNYCFSLHVGWIGCRMDSLPAALVVWMAVLPDAGPAYFLLLSGEGSVAGPWMAGKLTQTGVPTGTMSV